MPLKDFIREFSSKQDKIFVSHVIKSISNIAAKNNIDIFYTFNKFNDKEDGIVKYDDFYPSLKTFELNLTKKEHNCLRNNLIDLDENIDLYKFLDLFDD